MIFLTDFGAHGSSSLQNKTKISESSKLHEIFLNWFSKYESQDSKHFILTNISVINTLSNLTYFVSM
jgi:hypothetical protein